MFFAVESKSQSLYHSFTANGNFVVPAGITQVIVEAWGAGGNGGGIKGSGGGGGGAYAKSEVTVIPGNSYPVKVGVGGAPVMADRNSSFDTDKVVAVGGNNGIGTTGGAGGLNTNCIGTVRYSGGNGGNGNSESGGGGGSSAAASVNGASGADASGNTGGSGGILGATFISGNGGAGGNSGTAGIVGLAPGGGGGGTGNGSLASGTGGNGQVIVTWECPEDAGDLSGVSHICYNGTTTFSSTIKGGTWTSSNTTYAEIDPVSGLITAKVAGAGKTVTMTYTVSSEGCPTKTTPMALSIDDLLTIGPASSTPTLCINTAMTSITHTTAGATGIGTPAGLPAGVTATWASNILTISGIPTDPGTFNYSIPVTATCGSLNATGTITVRANNTVSAGSSSPTTCINTPLPTITHTTTGATGIGTPTGLPAGVTAAWASNTLTISGTPTVSGTFTYSIPLTGGCGSVNATGTITVRPNNTVSAGSSTPTTCINTPLPTITHTTTGATGIGTPTSLPAGVTAAWASNTLTVSGTPTESGTFNYSIPLTGGCGSINATGTITVFPTPNVVATPASQTICSGETTSIALSSNVSGATFSWTISQSGVSGATAGSGSNIAQSLSTTGTAAGTATYTITPKANGCNGNPVNVVITVNPTPTVNTPGNKIFCNGEITTAIPLSGSPTGVVFDISGGVAIGLANQTGVTAIPSFTPVAGTATITLTPTANGCSGSPLNFFITVNDTPTLLGATQSTPVCAGLAAVINLTGLRPTTTSTIEYSINNIAQTPVTNIISNNAGNASFTTTALTAANNSQILKITGITITSNASNCKQDFSKDVTLTVNTPPTFTTCPASLSLNTSAGNCTAVGSYSVVTSGQPAPAYTYAFTGATTGSGTGTGSGATFNAGTTHVKVTATNTCGSVDCTFDVVVSDNLAPVILNCPSNITVNTGAGSTSCDQTASWTEPTATDNCTLSGSLVWTKSHTPGTVFPVGTTTVTYTVQDARNNSSSCTFTVTVIDNTSPVFTAPSTLTIYSDVNCDASRLPAITGNVSVKSDNCTPSSSLVVGFTDAPNVAGACPGSYSFTRTWTVTDLNGNTATGTQVITVADNIKPTLTVPPAKAISCTESQLPANTGQATATDNCSGAVTITYTDVTTAGICLGNSTITRTWKATDCSGNFTTASQTITITDNLSPVVTINNLVAATPDVIPASYTSLAAFQVDGGTATDNCSNVSIVLWDEIANGLEGKPGYCPTSIVRTYRFTDACGNFTDKVQTITIQGDGGCNKCTSGTTFEWVDLMGQPSGTLVFSDLQRNGKCCNAGKSDDCISFNVRIDDNAVGVEILIDGATPSSQDWRIDCNPISMANGMVCMPGGDYHLFTFCKPGGNTNTYTFRSIPGVVTSDGISTRVDCSGQITTTGIVSGVTWNSISPGVRGQYNSYLSSTTVANPIFTAGPDAPSVIKYEVCGNIGTTICNALGRDCAEVTVNVKQKIALSLNVNPTLTCVNNPLVLVADINPSSNYSYEWHSGQGANAGPVLSTSKTLTLQPPVALGWYSLKVTDMDANGVACSTSTFDFQVQADITGPSILTPPSGDLTVNCNDPNANTQIQNWLASATSSDESGNPLSVSHNYTGIAMACGTILPVTFSATDNCGNLNTATSNIRVIDNQAPAWATGIGVLNRSVSCSDAAGFAAAQALEPNATDLCDPTLTLTKTSGSFVPGSCPHTGTYTNTWVAKDDCNNTSLVYTQTITITDTTSPVFTTQAQNLTVECNGSGNLSELNNWISNHGGAQATDACGGAITWSHSNPVLSDLCGSTGSATVTFTATDECGNSANSQATFIIADTQGPIVTCPAPASGTTDNNECYSSSVVLGTPTASDNCSAPVTFTNNAPAHYPVGVTTVIWTATDACGNQSTCNQTVTVTDNNQPPTIVCHGDVEDLITTNNCSKIGVVIPLPDISDNCPDPVLSWKMTGATTATGLGYITTSQVFNVGKTIVTYTVTDAGGHTASCSFQVWIKNLDAPKFKATCSANSSVTAIAPLNECQVNVPIETPTIYNPCNEYYTITNNSPYKTSDLDASGLYPVGVTNFTWTITDASGNITTCNQKVTVSDNQAPTIACQGNVEDLILVGGCTLVSNKLSDPVITDNCPAPVLTYHLVFENGTTSDGNGTVTNYSFPVGRTQVTYTVTDAGGRTATCSFQVWIKNIANPHFKVTCPAGVDKDLVADAEVDQCDASVTFKAPGIDNYCEEVFGVTYQIDANPAVPVAVTGSSIPSITRRFSVGNHTISWVITSASGTAYSCTQTVTVNDTQAPTIKCQGDVEDLILDGGCTLISSKLTDPVITDNCPPPALTYHLVFENGTTKDGSGSVTNYPFPIGKTQVTYTVTDAKVPTQMASCSFQVWIKNIASPNFKVICPSGTDKDIVVAAEVGKCDANVTFKAPVIDNYCEEVYSVTYQIDANPAVSVPVPVIAGAPIPAITQSFSVGSHNISWVVTSASGTAYTCNQSVTVNDEQKPTITCPSSFTVQANPNQLYATLVSIPQPTNMSDNCNYTLSWTLTGKTSDASTNYLPNVSFMPSPYPKLNLGDNMVTYTIDDGNGNVVTCSFTITVQGIPEIECPADIPVTTDQDKCTAALDPGVPTLKTDSPPADTWKWEMSGATIDAGITNSGTTPTPIGSYNFNEGITIITWTVSNISGATTCIQKITVTDDQLPAFDSKDHEFCVSPIVSAIYDGQPEPNADIIPEGWKTGDYRRPDWYIVNPETKELDITNLWDNCCDIKDLKIEWTIDFSDSHADISGTGQPSEYDDPAVAGFPNPIKLWGATNYTDIQHTIKYTVTDCNDPDNKTEHTQYITIKPRPNIIKTTN